jgi:chlorophyll/bacteriochlorophyll a synthase
MANLASTRSVPSYPSAGAVLELLKPITWFPPMWAFGCGAVSAGVALSPNWMLLLAGIALSGPLVCGTSQAVNDWYDRHVDAINEPKRPIPSGRVPGRWGLYIAIIWSLVSLIVAALIGPVVFWAAAFGLASLGLQRAAAAAQAEWLVGQCGGGALL